ncbi:HNH endonuclease signature motif containing protein [Amycolatopsis taiwanensis]|uniref:HNH nuclease domain-containing protein n=1 Tax=Amycolatopsis taiwanensis TaxID=342230 RepID=A0A9W6QWW3_9PSEU|nr:HNH endonuclease signature motif containing protein [Amycolatopsis taiwanensis]GLY64186.1 hypothetical protein Atai01_08050 [Amycolatopsis taiwanensis]
MVLRELTSRVAVVTRARIDPPKRGDEYANRTEIAERFGGSKVPGIMRFPGNDIVNAFSDENGPYADEPPDPVQPFEYRGEGRKGNQTLIRGNKMLDEARQHRRAVRFWYRPAGGKFTFVTWVAVLDRAQEWAPDDDQKQRLEYTFLFMSVPGPDPGTWPRSVLQRINDGPISDEPPPPLPDETETADTRKRSRSYREYVDALGPEPGKNPTQPAPSKGARNNYRRDRRARGAVLIRAAGQCENDGCTGMPPDTTADGSAILEVDHVHDLALGGPDHPSQMIALCPNCHAAKTRGRNRGVFRRHLQARAAALHRKALADTDGPETPL